MRKSSLLIIFSVVFIDLIGFGIVIPILPYYARQYGASAWTLGWLMTSYSLMQFLVAPIWGRVSDFVGRRPVILCSQVGTCASMILLGFAPSLKWLFIGRIFAGISAANISTAYAYVSDVTTEENRAKGMGLIGAGFGLGFIFGPAIGGLLSRYGYAAPMFAAAGLGVLNFIFTLFKLEEPKLSIEARASNRTRKFSMEAIRTALGDLRSRGGIGLFLLITFAVTQMEVVFAIYMKGRFNYDAQHAGMVLAIMGIIMVLIQGGLIGRLSKKFGPANLIIFGAALCSLALLGFASSTTAWLSIVALSFMAAGHGILHPSLSTVTSLGASPRNRGATMGVFHSAGSLARVLGPPCAGWLFDQVGATAPFYSAAIVLAGASAIAILWNNQVLNQTP